ncbi:MAG: LacI family transcriptional regulator [Clostridia bacterium]|nr:LacI family transcriptional regulator [Clostridia bacterium]
MMVGGDMSNIKDIAKKVNVSISTVSRVINNKSYVKDEVRDKVLAAAEELNYTQNQLARGLKNKESKTIGLIIPDISDEFFTEVIKGIDKTLTDYGYSAILCITNENPERENMYLDILMKNQVDGIILATVNKESAILNNLINKEFPLIFIDNLPKTNKNINSVILDNSKASYLAIEYLIKQGHIKIAGIMGKQDETTGFERYTGFKKAFYDYKVELDKTIVEFGDFKEASGYAAMTSLLAKHPDITAVYCASSQMTYGAIKGIKAFGKTIPKDISVIGFDIHDKFNLLNPAITTIKQPEEQIGIMSVEFLLNSLKKSSKNFFHKIVLDPELLILDSCRKI